MIPYADSLILDNTNHYGILKTEAVFRLTPAQENRVNANMNSTDHLEWIYTDDRFGTEDFTDKYSSRSLKPNQLISPQTQQPRNNKDRNIHGKAKKSKKKIKKRKGKLKKCVMKFFKKGKSKHKKFIMPLILGLLAAKSLLIPIALKTLAFISAKGLIMGFFSTMLASALSLKGMFEHSHGWNRRDDTKTQVEIIQVPSKSDDHIYYDHIYKRGDRIPFGPLKYLRTT